jgi:hypothetical protein
MRTLLRPSLFALGAVISVATHAGTLPADTTRELHQAARELEQAALLRYVASDGTEARHLLAARDLLREAEGGLHGPVRENAMSLDWRIGRDLGASAVTGAADAAPDALGPVSALPALDRGDLGVLAQWAQDLVTRASNAA